jgi:pyrroline-5-carboxylate reductase
MVQASVIGCGNMGGALIKGLAATGGHEITCIDVDPDALAAIEAYCAETTTEVGRAPESDVVVLAVKPDLVADVLAELDLSAEHTLVSIAAGVPTSVLAGLTEATVVRVMPNLAAETRDMAAAVTAADGPVPEAVWALLEDVGIAVEIEEVQMDLATALNGSGPAFVFYCIKAMRDAAVDRGMTAEDAELLAAQTFKGAAETVLRADRSLEELIDAVCSPKGTTIEGMAVLRDSDVADVLGEAVFAAEERSAELALDATDD